MSLLKLYEDVFFCKKRYFLDPDAVEWKVSSFKVRSSGLEGVFSVGSTAAGLKVSSL